MLDARNVGTLGLPILLLFHLNLVNAVAILAIENPGTIDSTEYITPWGGLDPGYYGAKFTVGINPINISQIGFWAASGHNPIHIVGIFNESDLVNPIYEWDVTFGEAGFEGDTLNDYIFRPTFFGGGPSAIPIGAGQGFRVAVYYPEDFDYFESIQFSSVGLTTGSGITYAGGVFGSAGPNSSFVENIIVANVQFQPVPEPSGIILGISGFLVGSILIRRKIKS